MCARSPVVCGDVAPNLCLDQMARSGEWVAAAAAAVVLLALLATLVLALLGPWGRNTAPTSCPLSSTPSSSSPSVAPLRPSGASPWMSPVPSVPRLMPDIPPCAPGAPSVGAGPCGGYLVGGWDAGDGTGLKPAMTYANGIEVFLDASYGLDVSRLVDPATGALTPTAAAALTWKRQLAGRRYFAILSPSDPRTNPLDLISGRADVPWNEVTVLLTVIKAAAYPQGLAAFSAALRGVLLAYPALLPLLDGLMIDYEPLSVTEQAYGYARWPPADEIAGFQALCAAVAAQGLAVALAVGEAGPAGVEQEFGLRALTAPGTGPVSVVEVMAYGLGAAQVTATLQQYADPAVVGVPPARLVATLLLYDGTTCFPERPAPVTGPNPDPALGPAGCGGGLRVGGCTRMGGEALGWKRRRRWARRGALVPGTMASAFAAQVGGTLVAALPDVGGLSVWFSVCDVDGSFTGAMNASTNGAAVPPPPADLGLLPVLRWCTLREPVAYLYTLSNANGESASVIATEFTSNPGPYELIRMLPYLGMVPSDMAAALRAHCASALNVYQQRVGVDPAPVLAYSWSVSDVVGARYLVFTDRMSRTGAATRLCAGESAL